MKLVKSSILGMGLVLLSSVCNAGPISSTNQKPYQVHIAPHSGMFVFYANVTSGTKPTCNGDNRWSVKTDRPGADALISMVLAAKMSDRTVTVAGSGRCNPDGWGYEISHMYIN